MKMKNYSLLFGLGICILSANFGFAQDFKSRPEFIKANSNWFTGELENIRYDFTTTPATVTGVTATSANPGTTILGESAAAVSDTATGQLLFFTNGSRCYNANYEMMPNGEALTPNTGSGPDYVYTQSTNQGAVIVPVIDSPGLFYVFSLTATPLEPGPGDGVLYYSKVDMSLNGGLGDVVVGEKAIVLDEGRLQESMAAVPGKHNDVWLLVHPPYDTFFKAYHITAAGIDTVPVLSSPGSVIAGEAAVFEYGSIAVSSAGDMIGIGSYSASCMYLGLLPQLGGYMVAHFDRCTGQVSNGALVEDSLAVYAGCFSPDGSKIYIQGVTPEGFAGEAVDGAHLVQYDLSNYDQSAIMASGYLVHDFYVGSEFRSMRNWNDTMIVSDKTYIANPNMAGAACNFQEVSYFPSMPINDGTPTSYYGQSLTLGTEAVYPLPVDTVRRVALDTAFCGVASLNAPVGLLAYQWDDGSTGSVREVTNSGTYWVAYNDGCDYKVDTFHIAIENLDPVITVDEFVLSTTLAYDTYQWLLNGELLDGATNNTYTVQVNGDYQVIVGNGNGDGCIDTSAVYSVTNVGVYDEHVMSSYVHVYPNPATDVIHIKSAIGVDVAISTVEGRVLVSERKCKEPISIRALAVGMYLIRIYDMDGRIIKIEKLIKTP